MRTLIVKYDSQVMADGWDAAFERGCNQSVVALCDAGDDTARQRAWRTLLRDIAPHIEAWARDSWLLRQWRLSSDDDARTVMVNVIARLQRNDFDNLRRYVARRSPIEEANDAQLTALTDMAKLAGAQVDDEAETRAAGTPLRAWLLTLVRFSTKDYVRQRMGWGVVAAGKGQEQGINKRSVATDAAPLSDAPERAARPPITDYLTVRNMLEEIDEFMNSFPHGMKAAVTLWMRDVSFTDIAGELELADAAAARKLVRAGHARLRERFRDRWSTFVG